MCDDDDFWFVSHSGTFYFLSIHLTQHSTFNTHHWSVSETITYCRCVQCQLCRLFCRWLCWLHHLGSVSCSFPRQVYFKLKWSVKSMCLLPIWNLSRSCLNWTMWHVSCFYKFIGCSRYLQLPVVHALCHLILYFYENAEHNGMSWPGVTGILKSQATNGKTSRAVIQPLTTLQLPFPSLCEAR